MGLFAKAQEKRKQIAADNLEEEIKQYFLAANCDQDTAYTSFYDDLVGKRGLDIATVITLLQIALYIWQWFRERNTPASAVMTVDIPPFDFAEEHEAALVSYGEQLGLAS